MTVDEIREIREKTSLKTIGMTTEKLRIYYAQGATDIERRIAEIRKNKGIATFSHSNDNTSEPIQNNTHGFIRGAKYYANLTNTKTDMAVHENPEDYN